MELTVEEVVEKLIGRWDYPEDPSCDIEIRLGDAPDKIIAIDHAECYWREGTARITNDYPEGYKIEIRFDTGVEVTGELRDDMKVIYWDNGTRWNVNDRGELFDEFMEELPLED